MNRNQSISRPFGLVFLSLSVGNVASFALHAIIVRGWGADWHGRLSTAIASAALISTVATLGITNGYGTVMVARRTMSLAAVRRLTLDSLWLGLLVTICLVLAFRPFLQDPTYVCGWAICNSFVMTARMILLATSREGQLVFTHPLGDVLRVTAIGLLFFIGIQANLFMVWSVSWLAILITSTIFGLFALSTYTSVETDTQQPFISHQRLIRRGSPYLLPWITYNLIPVGLPLVIHAQGSSQQTSIMQVLTLVTIAPRFLAFPLKTILLPKMAYRAQTGPASVERPIRSAEVWTYAAGVCAFGLAFWLLSPLLHLVFGSTYQTHFRTGLLLLTTGVLEAIGIQTDIRFESAKQQGGLFSTELGKVVLFVIALFALQSHPLVERTALALGIAMSLATASKLLLAPGNRNDIHRRLLVFGSITLFALGVCTLNGWAVASLVLLALSGLLTGLLIAELNRFSAEVV